MLSRWRLGGFLALLVLSNGALIVAEEAAPASALKVENLLAPKRARFFFFSSDQPADQSRHRIAPPTGKLEFTTARLSRKDAAESLIKTSSMRVELEGEQVRLRGNGFEIDASYVIQRWDAAALSDWLVVRRTPSSAEFEWGDLSGEFSKLSLLVNDRALLIEPAENGTLRITYAPSTSVMSCRAMKIRLDSQLLNGLFGPGGLE